MNIGSPLTSGATFFFIGVALFLLNLTMTILRAIRFRKVFTSSFYDEGEGVWVPVSVLSFATILIGIISLGIPYSGDWLIVTCEVLFWVYFAMSALCGLVVQNTMYASFR